MKKKRKLFLAAVCIVAVLLLAARIYRVNQNARLPEINRVPQGETVSWRGLEYRVVSAELWDYTTFFENHTELGEYDTDDDPLNTRILLVGYELTVEKKENQLDLYIPIQYEHTFNGIDPFMTAAMNPKLSDGTFRSGDVVTIPYEIYRANLTDSQWDGVNNLTMEYAAVLGTYPVKNELQITDIRKAKGNGQ